MSRRIVALLVAVPVLLAVAGALVSAASDERDLVLRADGFAGQPIPVASGARVCQRGLTPDGTVRAVRFGALPGTPSDQRVTVSIREGGRTLARGRPVAARTAPARRTVVLDRPVREQAGPLEVCFSNRGRQTLQLVGSRPRLAERDLVVAGRARPLALQLDLLGQRRSALAMVGTVLDRASVLRPGVVGPALFAVLFLVALLGAPAMLTAALRSTRSPGA